MRPSRQIHLDFHTSEFIDSVGEDFSKADFEKYLRLAKVNSINLFAKCHHSWSYYPTKIGEQHPNLKFDLLGQQIEVCQKLGIEVNLYYTVGWSFNDAEKNPDWCVRNKDGTILTSNELIEDNPEAALPSFHWKFLCLNSPYHLMIMKQVEELCKLYQVNGFWFDIYQVYRLSYTEKCKKDMKEMGFNLNDPQQVEAFNASIMKRHCEEVSNLIKSYNPKANIFFNGTTAIDHGSNFFHDMYAYNTTQDLEDLPTTWGGYDKLPLQSKYFLNAGYPITAMSGKFHTQWGEFGGFKHPDALKYEAASMIAYGANCNFGDQLHPSGKMDESTYKNIGLAFDYVEKIEDYGLDGKPVSRLGIWRSFDEVADEGLVKMLLEEQIDFDVANLREGLSNYEVIIFPSNTNLSEDEIIKVQEYYQKGGKIISFGEALLDKSKKDFILDLGVEYIGTSDFDCDYTKVNSSKISLFVETPFLNYSPAIKTKVKNKASVLADIYEPYFNRKVKHFCSHQNTPNQTVESNYPAVVHNDNSIFIAHQLDRLYYNHGARIHRELFIGILKLFYLNPNIRLSLPSTGRISLLHQDNLSRYVLHLLYSSPIKRGDCSVIEDFPELLDIKVQYDFSENIKKIYTIPEDLELKMVHQKGQDFVILPKLKCHSGIVFEY